MTTGIRPRTWMVGLCLAALACQSPPATPPAAAPPKAPTSDARVEARAEQLLAAAQRAEPTVTKTLLALAESVGGEMYKLEYRLKKRKSLLRKMRKQLANKPDTNVDTMTVNDALRYTMRVEDEPAGHYVQTVRAVLSKLETDGHSVVKLKNYWPQGDNYSGVNTVLKTAEGLLWELQFHTKRSIETNASTRVWYEELRKVDTPVARKQALFDRMAETWAPVPIPKDVLRKKSLHEAEQIIQLPRP